MKFSVGDKVVLKGSGDEGIVHSIIDRNLVEVESAGVTFPAYVDDLEHPYLKWFMEKKNRPKKKADETFPVPEIIKQPIQRKEKGMRFSFMAVSELEDFEEVIRYFKVHFVNETLDELEVFYHCSNREGTLFELRLRLHPFSHVYLHDLSFFDAGIQTRFRVDIQRKSTDRQTEMLNTQILLKPRQLMQQLEQMRAGNKAVFTLPISGNFIPVQAKEKPSDVSTSRAAIKERIPTRGSRNPLAGKKKIPLIDLHLESLAPHAGSWSNFEILSLQLNALESALETAISFKQDSMIVIHGVGKGKLKEEVHRLLRLCPEVRFFQQNWSPRFGFGATEVFFEN